MIKLVVWFICGTVIMFIVLTTADAWLRGYFRGLKKGIAKGKEMCKACKEQAEHEMYLAGVNTSTKDGNRTMLKRYAELLILAYKDFLRDQ